LAQVIQAFLLLMRPLYVLAVCITFIASLGNRPQSARNVFMLAIGLFGIMSLTMLLIIVSSTYVQFQISPTSMLLDQIKGFKLSQLADQNSSVVMTLVSLVATYGVYIISSFLYLEFYHPTMNILQYTVLLPTYVNVLQIYAYCNISDLSWGTKGDSGGAAAAHAPGKAGAVSNSQDELAAIPLSASNDFFDKSRARFTQLQSEMQKDEANEKNKDDKEDNFKKFRTIWLLTWIFVNGVLIGGLLSPSTLGLSSSFQQMYLVMLFLAVLVFSIIRFVASMVYWLGHTVTIC
jgi:chitin synthase